MPNEFRVKRGLIVEGSGSNLVSVDGVSGRLFSVSDSFSGSLFSVNTVAGLPVIEAFSDNSVRIGQYGQRALFVSQSRVGIGKESALNGILDVSGSVTITGSVSIQYISGSPTSGGLILGDPASSYAGNDNYSYPQIRLRDYRTGITLLNNDETHIVGNTIGIVMFKNTSGTALINLDSTAALQWSATSPNSVSSNGPILKRGGANILELTGSLKISGDIIGAEPIPAGAKLYLFYNY
jgi:hypothetical protein